MQSFLEQLKDQLQVTHGKDLSGLSIIFPTRRAGLFFRQVLASDATEPFWAPRIFTIQEFISELSRIKVADPVSLQFILFRVYKKYFPAESFDRFYPWGELMLQDFSDIDRYHASAEKVFSVIGDLREIEQNFSLDEEELARLKSFWLNYFSRDPSKLKAEFINTWKNLGPIYNEFRQLLFEDGIAYEGLAFRDAAERISLEPDETFLGYGHMVFAGFYALTTSEEIIIRHCMDRFKAEIFWDADKYYADDNSQEAGTFLRKGKLTGQKYRWNSEYFGKNKKSIETTGIPLMIGQAKYAGQLLKDMASEKGFLSEKTAVVLPDESLLFPLLYSLPDELSDINVTMGYPLRVTPMYHLFESLVALLRNKRQDGQGTTSYYYKDVLHVLQHPYIRPLNPGLIRSWLNEYSQFRSIRVDTELFPNEDEGLFFVLFRQKSVEHDIFNWFRQILRMILDSMKQEDFRYYRLESEIVVQFYTHMNRLSDAIEKEEIEINPDTFWFMFREIIQSVKIPFAGEPLKGLQVMGFLETRVLDFDRVIVLSVNEDVLPASGNKPSFIPFNIRKAFGLPTYEDQHAVSAYHFYRLLQRATNIHLLYNTESKAIAGGDKSRFLLQLEHELAEAFPDNIHLVQKVLSTGFGNEKIETVAVQKTAPVMKELSKYFEVESGMAKHFSASALTAYINCPLKFYLTYIAGMREEEEAGEFMEAAEFGNVLHYAMQLLYSGCSVMSESDFSRLEDKVDVVLDQAIHEKLGNAFQLEGKNILLRKALRELILKILTNDKQDAPIRLISLEQKVDHAFRLSDGRAVSVRGIIDRMDERNGSIRVLDYKTGRVDMKKFSEVEELFSDPVYKEQFQAILYAAVVRNGYRDKDLFAGLITLRDMSSGVRLLNGGEPLSNELFTSFEKLLKRLISEILNPEIPFTQTEDERRCKYCAFKGICNRA